jgi:hypothetical protein
MPEDISNNPKSSSIANNLKSQQQQVSKHKSPARLPLSARRRLNLTT